MYVVVGRIQNESSLGELAWKDYECMEKLYDDRFCVRSVITGRYYENSTSWTTEPHFNQWLQKWDKTGRGYSYAYLLSPKNKQRRAYFFHD